MIYNSDGDAELAEKSFRQAVSSDSSYTRAKVYYGAFLYSQGRMEESRDQFRAASKDTDYKDRGSVFYNLGMTQERLGLQDEAAVSYRRASELSRGDARSLLSLSRVMVDSGDIAGAARHYDRLTQIMARNERLLTLSRESVHRHSYCAILWKSKPGSQLGIAVEEQFSGVSRVPTIQGADF